MNENARIVFEQYWLHARHIENHRLWLSNITVAVFAALLAWLEKAGSNALISYVAIFGLLLSLFGLISMHAFRVPFIRFSRMAEIIMCTEFGLSKYKRFPSRDKFWSVHRTYIILYSVFAGGWTTLLLFSLTRNAYADLGIFIGVSLFLYLVYRLTLWRREEEIEQEVESLQAEPEAKEKQQSSI